MSTDAASPANVTDPMSTPINGTVLEVVSPTKYNIAMTILQQQDTDGEGMVLSYQDYEDEMSRLQFSHFIKDMSNVAKMLSILSVYRPLLLDKIKAAIDEPVAGVSNGPQPSAVTSNSQLTGLEPV